MCEGYSIRGVLKENGQVVHRSTYRPLTPEESQSNEGKQEREVFNKLVEEKLGLKASEGDFEDIDAETPTFELYEDDVDGVMVLVGE